MGNLLSNDGGVCDSKSLEIENLKLKNLAIRYEDEYRDYKYKVGKLCDESSEKIKAENNMLRNLVETNKMKRDHWRELYSSHST